MVELDQRSFQSLPELTAGEYDAFCALIHARSGIHLGTQKNTLLRSRLSKRLRALGLNSFGEYYDYLRRKDPMGSELKRMLDAISTNLTEFFREDAHFEQLKQHFFERWKDAPEIRILSAGCSSGEEPYSIAMCAREALGTNASRIKIEAGDLSTQALAQAQSGVYTLEKVKNISAERLRAFFLRGTGPNMGLVSVGKELRGMVRFQRVNLMEPLPYTAPFHAIFCRNVAIYFDRPTQQDLMEKLQTQLVPGGTLYLGHSESLLHSPSTLTYVQPSVYEKK